LAAACTSRNQLLDLGNLVFGQLQVSRILLGQEQLRSPHHSRTSGTATELTGAARATLAGESVGAALAKTDGGDGNEERYAEQVSHFLSEPDQCPPALSTIKLRHSL
jgi:hypothetical protein